MSDNRKTKKQLLNELIEQRHLLAELKASTGKLNVVLEDLRAREQGCRELVDLLPLPIFEMDNNLYITFANSCAFDTFGYSQKDLVNGIHGLQVIIPEEREHGRVTIQKRLKGEPLGGVDFTGLRKDGRTFPIIIHSSPIYENGKLAGLRGIVVDISDRKQTEEDLRRSEEKYRTMIEHSNDMIWTLDKEGHFSYFNKRAEEVSGLKLEEWIGKSFAPLIPPEELPRIQDIFLKTMEGETQHYDVSFYGKDGEIVILSVNTTPIIESSEITGTVSFGQVITEKKRAEESLRASKDSIRALLDATEDIALLMDINGTVLAANENAAKGFGTTVNELIGKCVMDYSAPPEIARLREERIDKIIRSKKPIHVEDRIQGRIYHGIGYPVLDDEGAVKRIAIFSHDVTRQKLAEEAILESEEKYRVLFETAKDAIFLTDENGRFVDVNQAACDSLGYTKEELLRLSNKELDADPAGFEAFKKIRNGLVKEVTFEVNQRRKDGTLLPVEITGSFFTSRGRRTSLAIARDITERTKAEEALKRVKEDLQRQNIELKKLDKMKDGLIRDATHELKTPVSKQAMQLELIRGMLAKGNLFDGVNEVLDVMDKSIKRQERVIRNILTLSRLEAGGRKCKTEPVRLDEVLNRVIDDYQHSFDSYGIRLGVNLEEITVASDEDMLWHIFSNLINNAVRFRKEKGMPRINISLYKNENVIIVKISDNGLGLSKEEKKKVFERFYQRETSNEGIGVGLTIVKMIAEELGCKIWLESAGRGKGTTAVLALTHPGPNQ